jgi:hypothetical protein
MDLLTFVRDISTKIIVAIITFILGALVTKVPSSLDKYRLRRFFGDDFFSDKFKIVYGFFERTDDETKRNVAIYEKIYSDRTKYEVSPSRYWITTPDSVRGVAYFVQEFGVYRKKPFIICSDKEALSHLHEDSSVCIGGPIGNELSKLALDQEGNKSLKFALPPEKRGYA